MIITSSHEIVYLVPVAWNYIREETDGIFFFYDKGRFQASDPFCQVK